MLAKEIKTGMVVVHNGAPHVIESISVQSPSARGGATIYKFRARNIMTKNKADLSYKGTEMLEDADFEKCEVTLMYIDAEQTHFMDSENFNQYSIDSADITYEMQFVTESLQGMLAMIYNEECVGISVPPSVVLKITQCDPGVKGNSATSRTKPALLETGATVHVPEYMKEGELIKIDTRTAEYTSRA